MPEEQKLMVSDRQGNGRLERVALSPRGDDRYVIDGRHLLECQPPLFWHDTIEAKEIPDGRLEFTRVLERANPRFVVVELGPHLWCSPVTALGDRRYCLEAAQYQVEPPLAYHDVIEAEPRGEARIRFLRRLQKSGLKGQVVTPALELLNTVESLSVLTWLTEQGGHWEPIWGNAIVLSVPKHVQKDLDVKRHHVGSAYLRGLIETGTAEVAGMSYPVLVSLDAYRDRMMRKDPALASVPPAPYLLFGRPHESGPLWRLMGQPAEVHKKKPETLESVSIPPDLRRRIDDWCRKGLEAQKSGSEPGYSGFADEHSERAFVTEGWTLYRELARVAHEPMEFWDFASGSYTWQAPDPKLEPPELGKGEDCRMLARTANYALMARRGFVQVLRRGLDETIEDGPCVAKHDPAVTCGVIAPDEAWCATGGCGVIVYRLRPPWEYYAEHRQSDQWLLFERQPRSHVMEMEALDRVTIKLKLQRYGEPIRDRLLDLATGQLL